ncbi:MAG TPA: hypothetical protein VFD71_16505 [Planctomycetota bacterium]|nr:hypothetical protein [Planctomycetota bacterium]
MSLKRSFLSAAAVLILLAGGVSCFEQNRDAPSAPGSGSGPGESKPSAAPAAATPLPAAPAPGAATAAAAPAVGLAPSTASGDAADGVAAPAPGTAPTAPPTADTAPSSTFGATVCDQLARRALDFYKGLPKDIGSLKEAAADNLALETEKALLAAGQFLSQCASHPRTPEVKYVSAKLLFLMSARHRSEWMALDREKPNFRELLASKTAGYMADIEKLAREAFETLPADDPLRPRSLELAGQAAGEGQAHETARKNFETFLTTFPTDAEADRVTLALGRSLFDLEQLDAALDVVKKGIEKYYASEQFPYFGELHWKIVHAKGDLDGMMEYVRRVDTVYTLKISGTDLKASEREAYDRFIDFNGFRKGYTLFARGDFGGARAAFEQHLRDLAAKDEKLQKEHRELRPEVRVYRERSAWCLRVLDDVAGLPVPVDLELGGAWTTAKQLRLAESRGKVVALTFRGVGDERSAAFIGPLSQWVAKQPGMEMVVVAYRKVGQPLGRQQDDMKEELGRLGFEGAAGFDPDETNKSIFRRFQANVGSATFLIINARGEVVWSMQDPRGIDVQFAERLLKTQSRA